VLPFNIDDFYNNKYKNKSIKILVFATTKYVRNNKQDLKLEEARKKSIDKKKNVDLNMNKNETYASKYISCWFMTILKVDF